ncbi:Ethanolamine ammonia-lyase light chain [Pedobacter westerhofensis]|uniref:Ethanolamine ammonia-lyase small subunit n=1 Tax=Pedobacter westerhofensis TaxID=425512 RepID=A0A521DY79_9SPHI|nr:ethanolamine ammonia-lyase subunit EutC [Pedobacter westerhofensis]SMO76673.1 Ethanolamine ammonia-lyase light chain [Pedobacter westerhofensis]
MENTPVKITDSWESLKEFTAARIALGRVGDSIPLSASLEFKLAHAHARDAVYSELEPTTLLSSLAAFKIPLLEIHSKAESRHQYLQRPDLGRIPDVQSLQLLKEHSGAFDISLILADGLSATAINTNVVPLLAALLPMLKGMKYHLAPICLASQSRVALSDHIAHTLGARLALMLIGERPGLSSADSVGAYLTYDPKPGLTDESRNCVSNIRPEGLSFELAAKKIFYLIREAFSRKLSGVELKDNAGLLEE